MTNLSGLDRSSPGKPEISPIQQPNSLLRPWEGTLDVKPWSYEVTAIIPVLDTLEPLKACLALLQAQTVKPYILVIDTGSVKFRDQITDLATENVEIHSLRSYGWNHPSEPVAVAQDLGFSLARTQYALSLHADCFLRKQTAVAELLTLAKIHKIVGFQISPRSYQGWESELGHTLLMTDLPTLRANNITWNMRKFCERYNKTLSNNCFCTNCPDTESEFNASVADAKIKPLILGTEQNRTRNINDWFDHPRSHTSATLYDNKYLPTVSSDMEKAIKDAYERLEAWVS